MKDAVRERKRWYMGPEARALTLVTSVLTVFGLATLYSASSMVAMEKGFSSTYYFSRQAIGVGVGLVLFAIAAKVDAERLKQMAWPLMALTIALMLVTVLPFTESIAPRVNGSRRFVIGTSLQPSELGKLAVVAWTAMLIVKKGEEGLRRLTKGLLPFLLVIGTLDVIAVFQPDLSVALMYTLVMAIMLFAGGARIGHFVVLAVVSIPILWPKMERLQYAIMRVTSFLDPGNAPEVLTYQLKQSLIAVGSGGSLGVGFGQGRQQYGFIPMGINDFVASNIGEEWGFLGLTLLVMAFAAYTYLGMRIARQARSQFQQLVAIGLTITMAMTAYLHIGVVIGLLPTTGLTLPFVSYGRSNLVLSFVLTGILVNMGSGRERVHHAQATDPLAAPA
jgi:cell division protein FtsW